MLHLVNNTGDMQRPMAALIPVHNVQIELRGEEVTRAYSARGVEVEMARTAAGFKLTVSELEVYDLIIVELS